MLLSMADFYRAISDLIPVDLISSKALAQICRTASFLPVLPSGGFECHLGDDQDQVDFWVILSREEGDRFPSAVEGKSESLVSHLRSYPFWRRICHFYDQWMEPTTFWHQYIQSLGFEFDIGGGTKELLIPSVFLSPHFSATSPDGGVRLAENLDRVLEFLTDFVWIMTAERLSTAMRSKVGVVLGALPAGAHVPFLGVMLSREPLALRFEISDLDVGELGVYLERISWPGSVKRLGSFIDEIRGYTGHLRIAIDIGEVVSPRIGLICGLDGDSERVTNLPGFLGMLAGRELCTTEQMRALLSWSGCSYDRFDPNTWPGIRNQEISPLGLIASNVFNRSINHIKIDYISSKRLNAKAYISYNVVWTGSRDPSRFHTLVERHAGEVRDA